MKYSKGPWKADSDNWVRDSSGIPFISIMREYRSRDEIYATRDLIASAPEMFEALERLDKIYSDMERTSFDLQEIRQIIRDALSKIKVKSDS